MKKLYRLFLVIFIAFLTGLNALAHEHATLQGIVKDSVSGEVLSGASVILNNGLQGTTTDAFGKFRFTKMPAGDFSVKVSTFGFSAKCAIVLLVAGETKTLDFYLNSSAFLLAEISVAQPVSEQNQTMQLINKVDAELRPVNSAQDLLRLVPGLFIAQHAGGGKVEQIFLRGFDVDHGTDFAVSIDGIPVNMVSHVHGQGYADFHFVIPETVDALQVYKGPYNARFGNFATAGAGAFTTKIS